MNSAHLHLILNHIPILLGFIGLAVMVWGLVSQNQDIKKVSCVLFVAAALFCIPVYLTGEPAEEVVENIPGVSEALIEEHEESALVSLIAIEIVGFLALIALWFKERKPKVFNTLVILVALLSVVSGVLISRTANLGGEIRHPEITKDFMLFQSPTSTEINNTSN